MSKSPSTWQTIATDDTNFMKPFWPTATTSSRTKLRSVCGRNTFSTQPPGLQTVEAPSNIIGDGHPGRDFHGLVHNELSSFLYASDALSFEHGLGKCANPLSVNSQGQEICHSSTNSILHGTATWFFAVALLWRRSFVGRRNVSDGADDSLTMLRHTRR